MDNVITISNVKQNTLEFDISMDGVSADVVVRFVIETGNMEIGFVAAKTTTGKWEVTIPALKFLKGSNYDFRIDVVTSGYYFEPLRGAIAIKSSKAPKTSKATKAKIDAKVSQITKAAAMTADIVDDKTNDAEEKVVKKEEKKIEGKSDDKEPESFPSVKTPEPDELAKSHDVPVKDIESQLKKGIEVEKEHTTDSKKAREIALDHIKEKPDYYDELEKVEEGKKIKQKKKTDVEKANIRSDTGERPAVNESASEGSTDSHNVQSGPTTKPKPKPKPAPRVDITALLRETATAPVVEQKKQKPRKVKSESVDNKQNDKLKAILAESAEKSKSTIKPVVLKQRVIR